MRAASNPVTSSTDSLIIFINSPFSVRKGSAELLYSILKSYSLSPISSLTTLSKIFVPPSNFLVTPYLSYGFFRPDFILEISEVSSIIEFPLNDLLKMKVSKVSLLSYNKISVEVPCYKYNKKIIWGATAMILSELKMIIQNTLTK